jgi:two-component system, LytTR family, response regulator
MAISNTLDGTYPVKIIDGIEFLNFSDIIRFEANDKLTLIYLANENNVVRSILKLSKIEEMLPSAFFFRCHRSHIIGSKHLKKFERASLTIQLYGNHNVPLAEERLCDFMKWIGY